MAKRKTRTGRGVAGKPGRRHELTDEAWERIEPLLPKRRRGGPWADHRTILNGMFWTLNSGAPWRDMPERYGKWRTVYARFRRWTNDGRIDWSVFDVDGSNIRARQSAAGASPSPAKKGRTRAPRPRPGTIPRRLGHEASSSDRRSRRAAGSVAHTRAGARVEALRGDDGHGQHRSPTPA